MIDFKFTTVSKTSGATSVDLSVYSGDITAALEHESGSDTMVTRYRRNKLLGQKSFSVGGDLSAKEIADRVKTIIATNFPSLSIIPEEA